MKFTFNPIYPNATNEQKWEQIRLWRNAQLSASDWTQVEDAPVDKDAWATYRQALRDLPAQSGLADYADIPAKPGGNQMATGRLPDPNTAPLTAKGDLYTYSTVPAKLAVGNNGDTLLADSATSTGLRYNPLINQNFAINGSFDFWQRGTSFTGSSKAYSADRWAFHGGSSTSGSFVISRQTSGLEGFLYCARVLRTSGQTNTAVSLFYQSLETTQSVNLANKAVTISFWARKGANYSAASDALKVSVMSYTGTDQNLIDYVAYNYAIEQQTATLTSSWQRFSFTGTVASNANELGFAFEYTPVGTAGAADYYEVAGVQLEIGSVATAWKRAGGGTLQGELAAARRYYQECQFTNGVAISTTSAQIWIQHNGMRVAPSAVASAALKLTDASTSDFTQSSAGISIVANNADAGRYDVGSLTGMTTNRVANLINGGGKVQLSAELQNA